ARTLERAQRCDGRERNQPAEPPAYFRRRAVLKLRHQHLRRDVHPPADVGDEYRLAVSGDREVDAETEVVARPNALEGSIEDPFAGRDLQGRPLVLAAADEDVVDSPEGPVTADHDRGLGRERVPGVAGVHALPGVAIADARAAERLPPCPEARARGLGVSVEVGGDDYVPRSVGGQLVEEACRGDCLKLALV